MRGARRACLVAMLCLLALIGAGRARAVGFGFETLPASGELAAAAGAKVGWGYQITNPTGDRWLSFDALDAGVFSLGTPDASLFDFPILAPGASLDVPYDGTHGLFAFTWSVLAPPGSVNQGVFTLAASWYDADPLAGGALLESADDATAAYRVRVVPEPGTGLLLGAGLAAFAAARRGCGRPPSRSPRA
jgi:PEP-CTERM motif-containing protein